MTVERRIGGGGGRIFRKESCRKEVGCPAARGIERGASFQVQKEGKEAGR